MNFSFNNQSETQKQRAKQGFFAQPAATTKPNIFEQVKRNNVHEVIKAGESKYLAQEALAYSKAIQEDPTVF